MKLRASLFWKSTAVLVMLASVIMTFFSGLGTIYLYMDGYGRDGTYFDSYRCENRVRDYMDLVGHKLRIEQELEDADLTYLSRRQMENAMEEVCQQLDAENTNFRYEVKSGDGQQVIATNLQDGESQEQAMAHRWYATIFLGNERVRVEPDYIGNFSYGDGTYKGEQGLVLECGLPGLLSVDDPFRQDLMEYSRLRQLQPWAAVACVGFAILALTCLVFLCMAAGHKKGVVGIHLNWQDRIWYDVYLAGVFFLGMMLVLLLDGAFRWRGSELYVAIQVALFAILPVTVLVLAVLLTTVTRCKAGVMWKNTLIAKVLGVLCRFIFALPITWKLVLAFVCSLLVSFVLFAMFYYDGAAAFILMELLDFGFVLYLCWWAVNFNKLRNAGQALAGGDLDYRVDTVRMPPDLRRHGEDLNNISGGMANAVQERMKSERFKSELITNVSHELKTPLTSIINYVDLLKKADIQGETALGYLRVLEEKSQRLKKLTEDLVEASKASTGVLAVDREQLDLVQLVEQAVGEYTEKVENRHLQMVTHLPEQAVWVNADGRHLWRVLDNLLSNCVKYAMEGTRVYLEVQKGPKQAVLTVKNISRDALNIPPEQLMERFVRGEESRTTEGSGLGLSIARSLTQLQGGMFDISVDGDLFKVTVTLPKTE